MKNIISYHQLVKNTVKIHKFLGINVVKTKDGLIPMAEYVDYYQVPEGYTLDLTQNILSIWGLI